ncbi:MAG: hypothetical protein K2L88_06265 [Clostridiales bacterium]|nr:hypothetical protein [Clostridiales bacterium]
MISVIYGSKGTGKTKRVMDAANAAAEKASGQVMFITDNNGSLGLNPNIRFVNVADYGVRNTYELSGFLKGMLATNFDIQYVFIDGLNRLLAVDPEALKPIFDTMEKFADSEFTATVSADKLPNFFNKFNIIND